jgi:predicted nucleic acid-binding protein
MSWADTHAYLDLLRGLLTVHPFTLEIHEAGLRLAERYGFAIYAMIVASALHAGCDTLWSEGCASSIRFEMPAELRDCY